MCVVRSGIILRVRKLGKLYDALKVWKEITFSFLAVLWDIVPEIFLHKTPRLLILREDGPCIFGPFNLQFVTKIEILKNWRISLFRF